MMRLAANTLKELRLGWRSYYFLLVVGVAIAYFLLVTFLIPEDLTVSPDVVVLNEMEEGSQVMENLFGGDMESDKLLLAKDRDDLEKTMNRRFNSVGIVLKGSEREPAFELVFQGHESQDIRELLRLSILQRTGALNSEEGYGIEYLEDRKPVDEAIPFNKSFLPVLLMSEAVMLGMFLVFAMIFGEKSEETIKAYSITPGRIWEYLGAKVIVLAILGVLFTLILTPMVVGIGPRYGELLLIVVVGSTLSTSIALIFASFYNNLSQSLVPMLGLSLVFGLPMISFFIPGFSPWYLRILPTYTILFALKGAVFPGSIQVGISSLWLIALEGAIAFTIAVLVYGQRVRKN